MPTSSLCSNCDFLYILLSGNINFTLLSIEIRVLDEFQTFCIRLVESSTVSSFSSQQYGIYYFLSSNLQSMISEKKIFWKFFFQNQYFIAEYQGSIRKGIMDCHIDFQKCVLTNYSVNILDKFMTVIFSAENVLKKTLYNSFFFSYQIFDDLNPTAIHFTIHYFLVEI